MSQYSDRLTIKQAQEKQPWTVPYSEGVQDAAHPLKFPDHEHDERGVPHILGTHCVLHAVKSLGKIAAVYEARDHEDGATRGGDTPGMRELNRRAEIRKMAADLMTAALRFANLEGFDLAEALVERVKEKNGADFGFIFSPAPAPVIFCDRCKACHAAPECP